MRRKRHGHSTGNGAVLDGRRLSGVIVKSAPRDVCLARLIDKRAADRGWLPSERRIGTASLAIMESE